MSGDKVIRLNKLQFTYPGPGACARHDANETRHTKRSDAHARALFLAP